MSRPALHAAVLAALSVAACASPHDVEVRLVHSRALVPEDAFQRLELRVVEEDTGREVARGSTDASLADPVELFDADALENGRRYVLEVRAEAPGACRLGRAVGRSMPFEHRDGGYAVSVQVGCADELARTRSRPIRGRFAHGAVSASDGEVVLLGGVSGALNDPPEGESAFAPRDMVADVERYDPTIGSFVLGGTLSTPRAWPAVVPLPDGAVGALGGYVTGGVLPCTDRVEVVTGLSTSTREAMAQPRCLPTAVGLDAGPNLVVGGAAVPEGEVYDAELESRLRDDLPVEPMRFGATVVPLADGESALVVGGVGAGTTPVAGIVHVDGPEAGDASFEALAMQGEPTDGYALPVAGYVPCDGGGGAVYLLGGQTGPEGPGALDRAWCYRDAPGAPPGQLVRAGTLPEPRKSAAGAAVPGPDGYRMLVVAGDDGDDSTLPYDDALLIPVDGCACGPIGEAERLPVPIDGILAFHSATAMQDDSVLVVGGVRIPLGGARSIGTGEAALFVPDLP